MNTYDKELDFAKNLAKDAGDVMRRYFRTDDMGTEWKQDGTPLTIADTTINDLVIKKVKESFPDHGVIGEESSYETGRGLVWVVDPIDGTMPFSVGIPVFTFSLGLVDKADGQSVVAVVYDPILDELYWATRSGGSFLNGKQLHTSSAVSLTNTYLSVISGLDSQDNGSGYRAGVCSDLFRKEGAKPLCLYSQVYSAAKVATGDFVGSVFGYGSPWDSAAVSLIVEEAGGVVTDLDGKKRRFDDWSNGCVLAANRTMLEKILGLVSASSE